MLLEKIEIAPPSGSDTRECQSCRTGRQVYPMLHQRVRRRSRNSTPRMEGGPDRNPRTVLQAGTGWSLDYGFQERFATSFRKSLAESDAGSGVRSFGPGEARSLGVSLQAGSLGSPPKDPAGSFPRSFAGCSAALERPVVGSAPVEDRAAIGGPGRTMRPAERPLHPFSSCPRASVADSCSGFREPVFRLTAGFSGLKFSLIWACFQGRQPCNRRVRRSLQSVCWPQILRNESRTLTIPERVLRLVLRTTSDTGIGRAAGTGHSAR
jgi:hypothetical protein